ncbi:conserved hypothetical protein [Cupriavidus taiwanensis]|uniref:phospholipase D family protein n=1 Tax=Cupriavidus taiwanensis TaxID=164546 RepID=UPI000E1AA572|nr:phospholipase D family protein [Cupriavidus taiwanensis]SPA36247.1 conserved hypothetical protein [Cupriavidus taiwanensis]
MSEASGNWPGLSYLEGLRPGPEERVELALLASYSADLGSIGAALLALGGKDTDTGSGSPTDFADAVEQLRGNVRVVIQRGRLAKMRHTPRIAAVLDQFVREVEFDESEHSWHPKVALVKMVASTGEANWRLWIGSRNLTECTNRDIGLLLVSGPPGGATIDGVGALARDLAERAELTSVRPELLKSTVAKVRWRAPAGVRVKGFRWSGGMVDEQMSEPIPEPGPRTDEIVVVSPFIDKRFLARQATVGKGSPVRKLLTTMGEIQRIGPSLRGFELFRLDAPDYPVDDPEAETSPSPHNPDGDHSDDEEEEIGRGLHAKLLYMRSGHQRRLWLGSANATMRGWSGRNAEVMADLLVSEGVADGLLALLGAAEPVDAPTSEHVADQDELDEKALEEARAQVAARWAVVLSVHEPDLLLCQSSGAQPEWPHPGASDIELEAGSLHGELLRWPRGQIVLNLGAVGPAERSEFVRLRVSRAGKGLSWLQRAPAEPPFGKSRDRDAFVQLLGGRGFLRWIANLLSDDERQGEGDWTSEHGEYGDSRLPQTLDGFLLTLEEMLSAWSRDPAKFRDIEHKVSLYLPAVLKHAGQEDPETRRLLMSFRGLWMLVRKGLETARKADNER